MAHSSSCKTAEVVSSIIGDEFATYKIQCTGEGGEQWTLAKRYSDFDQLQKELTAAGLDVGASFPKKAYFGKAGRDPATVTFREAVFKTYLSATLAAHPTAPALAVFLANPASKLGSLSGWLLRRRKQKGDSNADWVHRCARGKLAVVDSGRSCFPLCSCLSVSVADHSASVTVFEAWQNIRMRV